MTSVIRAAVISCKGGAALTAAMTESCTADLVEPSRKTAATVALAAVCMRHKVEQNLQSEELFSGKAKEGPLTIDMLGARWSTDGSMDFGLLASLLEVAFEGFGNFRGLEIRLIGPEMDLDRWPAEDRRNYKQCIRRSRGAVRGLKDTTRFSPLTVIEDPALYHQRDSDNKVCECILPLPLPLPLLCHCFECRGLHPSPTSHKGQLAGEASILLARNAGVIGRPSLRKSDPIGATPPQARLAVALNPGLGNALMSWGPTLVCLMNEGVPSAFTGYEAPGSALDEREEIVRILQVTTVPSCGAAPKDG